MKKWIILGAIFVGSLHAADNAKALKKMFKKKGCVKCHNVDGMGKAKDGIVETYKGPRIAGLDADYAVEQIKAIASGERKTKTTKMMKAKAKKLSDEDIKKLADYAHSLGDKYKGMLEK